VVLEDDVLALGGDVPTAEMDQIVEAITKDLKVRLSAHAARVSSELAGINDLLSRLIGEP